MEEGMAMENSSHKQTLISISKSKFVRSISVKIVSIFLFIVVAIIAIVFFSFTSEISNRIISERQKQLEVIENTISKRMEEISSIAYNISNDGVFYLETLEDHNYTGHEMTKTLERYLVGNDFIEHLAYYRLSEPDVIYASCGELSVHDFWNTYLDFDSYTEEEYFQKIKESRNVQLIPMTAAKNDKSYVTYICGLPQFSQNPQAFVIFVISSEEVKPILESQLLNCYGQVTLYDAMGNEIYQVSNMGEEIPIILSDVREDENISWNGSEYMVQKEVSESNGWTYVSVIRRSDIISEVANKQLVFIILLLVLILLAIFALLICIVVQYKPINNLAMTFTDELGKSDGNMIIDEESLLTDTFATLKDDSEQKQKFEAAYYEAEAANKAKSTFLSNMSHDIRTPMNAIVGMTEIAIKNSDNAAYVKECLQNVRVASQYLLDIINNVLDMSRIESGKFSLSEEEVEFPKLIHGMIAILNHNMEVKSQKLIISIDNVVNEKVIGDSVRLTQVFIQLYKIYAKWRYHQCPYESE